MKEFEMSLHFQTLNFSSVAFGGLTGKLCNDQKMSILILTGPLLRVLCKAFNFPELLFSPWSKACDYIYIYQTYFIFDTLVHFSSVRIMLMN